jgi:drug/metabolite transporter (DMT)-like permease
MGFFWAQKSAPGLWIAVPLAAIGLYLLSVTESFTLASGDGWVMACAFAWAGQILFLGWLSPRINSFVLAFGQSCVCAVLSLIIALIVEEVSLPSLWHGLVPVLYGGVVSVGIGFTLQVIAQKDSPPAHAAIIFQFEAVVAAVSGWLILGEIMGLRARLGAAIMFAAMLVAQLWVAKHPCSPLAITGRKERRSQKTT